MAPFLGILAAAGRPVVVTNTHADWDHVWGNAAFPGSMLIGQQRCRARLLGDGEQRVLQDKRSQEPEHYANVRIIAPEMSFETTLEIDLGGLTVQLHHLPGHTEDAVMAYVPERRLLFAADCAEDPFPQLYSGPLDSWIEGLHSWAARDLATVIPAHGRIGGPALLRANAAYLEGLRGENIMPNLEGLPAAALPFYREGHESNRAMAERLSTV